MEIIQVFPWMTKRVFNTKNGRICSSIQFRTEEESDETLNAKRIILCKTYATGRNLMGAVSIFKRGYGIK